MPLVEESRHPFEPYPFLAKSLSDGQVGKAAYLIYSTPTECKRVEASTASEAIALSEVKNPCKVIRQEAFSQLLMEHTLFSAPPT